MPDPTYIVQTTMNPGVSIEVDEPQYLRLLRLGVVLGGPADPVSTDVFGAAVASSLTTPGSAAANALAAAVTAAGGAHTHTLANITDASSFGRQLAAAADAAALRTLGGIGSDAAVGTASMRTLGTGAQQAAAGNDSRFTNARTPTAHASTHATGGSDLLTPANIGAALASHSHATTDITNLTEAVQDIVGAFLVAGVGTTVTYDDVANTFTINATGGGGGSTDPEIVRDVIGTAIVAGAGVQVTVNDAGDTITIASTAVLPTRQVLAGTGLSGGGDLSVDRTLAVAYGNTAGTAVQGNDARVVADAAAGTASIRTIGTGALQAAAGNHSHAGLTADQAVGTASVRTLGTGALQAAAGNHSHAGLTADQAVGTASVRTLGTGALQAKPGDWLPPVNDTGAAATVLRSSKVTGDTTNRFERRVDGSISVGPGGLTALRTDALLAIDLGNELDRHGISIRASSNQAGASQPLAIYDYLGAPIFTVPEAGGPAVFGDNFRVFGGGNVFDHEISLRLDGTVTARRGDPAGGAGVLAIGAATTAPTRNPDGSVLSQGSDTDAGIVLWADANGRTRIRRASGPIDVIGGHVAATAAPTVGVVEGDTYFNSTSKRLHYRDASSWPRLGLAQTPTGSPTPKVGEYLMPPWMFSATQLAPVASTMTLLPFDVNEAGQVFDRVGVQVVGAGAGGTPAARMGIYADDGTGAAPSGAPVVDFGLTPTMTTANTTTVATINWTAPRVGRFWLAIVYQPVGTVTTIPTWAQITGQTLPQTNLDLTFPIRSLQQTGVTGALPTIGTLVRGTFTPAIGLRRSA